MKSIAIIPARGGSKRITRKNVKDFRGKPVIAYAIQTAIESQLFDEIFVSTDDQEISKIAQAYGARVPWLRDLKLADDFTTTSEVINDALHRIQDSFGEVKNACCIYPVTPLLEPSYLVDGLRALETGEWDFVVSAKRTRENPQKFFALDSNLRIELYSPEFETTRTQDLETSYLDAAQFYWGTQKAWQNSKGVFSSKSTIIEVPEYMGIDVDIEGDWIAIEKAFDLLNSKKSKF